MLMDRVSKKTNVNGPNTPINEPQETEIDRESLGDLDQEEDYVKLLESCTLSPNEFPQRLQLFYSLQRVLVESQDYRSKFVRDKGLDRLLSAFSGFHLEDETTSTFDNQFLDLESLSLPETCELVRAILAAIGIAMQDPLGYYQFNYHLKGYNTLYDTLISSRILSLSPDSALSYLISLATNDLSLSSFISSSLRYFKDVSYRSDRELSIKLLRDKISTNFSDSTVENPQAFILIVRFLIDDFGFEDPISTIVLLSIEVLTRISVQNRSRLSKSGTIDLICSTLVMNDACNQINELTRKICLDIISICLIDIGLNVKAMSILLKSAVSDPDVALLVQKSISAADCAQPRIVLDFSQKSKSSIYLPSLASSFPLSSSSGYTLSLWFWVNNFDPSDHLNLIGIFDKDQRTFLLLYIEKGTNKLIIQTSSNASSSSCAARFRSVTFQKNKLYNLSLRHKKGRMGMSSKVSLFIDGLYIEAVKCAFPISSGDITPQVFIGCPQQLSSDPQEFAPSSSLKWSFVSARLFESLIPDDLILLIYHLKSSYRGNFRDSLGRFLTYQASGMLNYYIESSSKKLSDLITAVRERGSSVTCLSKLLLNVNASFILSPDWVHFDKLRFIAPHCEKFITFGETLVFNAASGDLLSLLNTQHGISVLTNDAEPISENSSIEMIWSLGGGSTYLLKLVDLAQTPKKLLQAVQIFFKVINKSWRISEDAERENAFGILASLIKGKDMVSEIGSDLLKTLLVSIGYDINNQSNSILINPLAYRLLILDFNIWKKAGKECLTLYFKQFSDFAFVSTFSQFNVKRLCRMKILKKLIACFATDYFPMSSLGAFKSCLEAMIPLNNTAETYQALSLFIAYCFEQVKLSKVPINSLRNARIRTRSSSDLTNLSCQALPVGIATLEALVNCLCRKEANGDLKRFAKAVTSRWILFLVSWDDPKVVLLGSRLLAAIIIAHGRGYTTTFVSKSNGATVLNLYLKRWWFIPDIWGYTLSIFLGRDLSDYDLMDLKSLKELMRELPDFPKLDVPKNPEFFSLFTSMIQAGVSYIDNKDKNNEETRKCWIAYQEYLVQEEIGYSLNTDNCVELLDTSVQILWRLRRSNHGFQNFCSSETCMLPLTQLLFSCMFPDYSIRAEMELYNREDAKSSEMALAAEQTIEDGSPPPDLTTVTVNDSNPQVSGPSTDTLRPPLPAKRSSSFVVVPEDFMIARYRKMFLYVQSILKSDSVTNVLLEKLFDFLAEIMVSIIIRDKEAPEIILLNYIPPSSTAQQTFFESYVLRRFVTHLKSSVVSRPGVCTETRVLGNLVDTIRYLSFYIQQGRFSDGEELTLDLTANILIALSQHHPRNKKAIKMQEHQTHTLTLLFDKILLHTLGIFSNKRSSSTNEKVLDILEKTKSWEPIILGDNIDVQFVACLVYVLYTIFCRYESTPVRISIIQIWRIVISKKTDVILGALKGWFPRKDDSSLDFLNITLMTDQNFLDWATIEQAEFDKLFSKHFCRCWKDFITADKKACFDFFLPILRRRKEVLMKWKADEDTLTEFKVSHQNFINKWLGSIHTSEHVKILCLIQDHNSTHELLLSRFAALEATLSAPGGLLFDSDNPVQFALDLTECRNRMRKKEIVQTDIQTPEDYLVAGRIDAQKLQIGSSGSDRGYRSRSGTLGTDGETDSITSQDRRSMTQRDEELANPNTMETGSSVNTRESEYEMVEEPESLTVANSLDAEDNDYEDKNRTVLKSLERGDQVVGLSNISRIIGLEISEGILLQGKINLYIIDNFFRRSDGEIVNSTEAPFNERDLYLELIDSEDAVPKALSRKKLNHEVRKWKLAEIMSLSKRRFLFRDVAIEVFFEDGSSTLFTARTPKERDRIYNRLSKKVSINGNMNPTPGSSSIYNQVSPIPLGQLGSKLANIFSATPSYTLQSATKKWIRGEMSNFYYLMIVNTLAGRTMNDMTQYPVFPWVIADYVSEELDLTKPETFRDFSKPMGAQTPSRAQEFINRYEAFVEMNDESSPPFHYGTHYSSAMIAASFLIRLYPFVKTYWILQGGHFDHPDRLFYSIERAWMSASAENTTDVRELIPEFFYLPEFLINENHFDFGVRQNNCPVDNVELPPWAKGDPKLFIAKNREALESPYVSSRLHEWIDLIFGYKQRGQQAIDAVNVFHHLSYDGAIDLDTIQDPVQRKATIGIIHNFGQTPLQIFNRPHPKREVMVIKRPRMDLDYGRQFSGPSKLYTREALITGLNCLTMGSRPQSSVIFRESSFSVPEKVFEWGFADGSLRLLSIEAKKYISRFEQLHDGKISAFCVIDNQNVITGGDDCTICVWDFEGQSKNSNLNFVSCLRGHRYPILRICCSREFNSITSLDSSGKVIAWDLNRHSYVRTLGDNASCIAVNKETGDVALSDRTTFSLFTINGKHIITSQVVTPGDEISCISFYEGFLDEWLEKYIILTGHASGKLKIWILTYQSSFELVPIQEYKQDRMITTISTVKGASTIYTGDTKGNVYEWIARKE